jgi:hypothetical protein
VQERCFPAARPAAKQQEGQVWFNRVHSPAVAVRHAVPLAKSPFVEGNGQFRTGLYGEVNVSLKMGRFTLVLDQKWRYDFGRGRGKRAAELFRQESGRSSRDGV